MNRNLLLAARIREVFLDGKWIANTNFKEQILCVNHETANYQVGNLNTIALLLFHVNYYLDGIINVFKGGGLEIRDKYSFDMSPVNSELNWRGMVDHFTESAEQFAQHVEELPDEMLDRPFVDGKYGSYLRNIDAMIEHGYYHLGQIVMIRKLVEGDFER